MYTSFHIGAGELMIIGIIIVLVCFWMIRR